MNAFNRVIMILLLLLLIVGTAITVARTASVITLAQNALSVAAGWLSPWTWSVFVLPIGIAVGVVWLILLLLEIWRRRAKSVRITKISGGRARLKTESIGRRIAWHVDRLADVVKVTPRVRASGSGVEIDLALETSPQIDVPMKTEEVLAVVRDQIEEKMGLKLKKVNVAIKHAPFPEEPAFAKEAAQSWSAATAPTSPPPATEIDLASDTTRDQ